MNKKYIAGIDEVGRGPLAGPVTIGFVVWLDTTKKPIQQFAGIKDSKKMKPQDREKWVSYIKTLQAQKIVWTTVVSSAPQTIDTKGIVMAMKQATKRACKQFLIQCDASCDELMILSDYGLPVPKEYKTKHIIRGDEKEPLIAAASIIAKVWRDDCMKKYHYSFPEYKLHNNKGYATKIHREAIIQYGASMIHRRSFLKNLLSS